MIDQNLSSFIRAAAAALILAFPIAAQEAGPVIVQPGAPGQPTRKLPADTRAVLPAKSAKDVEFMRGMIMHHAQAVEMTALIEERTKNKHVRLLGSRISQSQLDEMTLMTRWLAARGEASEMKTSAAHASHSHGSHHSPVAEMRMPGMLSSKQMADLKAARDAAFDKLFLLGMIQHHEGALAMVKDLFDTAGAGQDAEIFSFATDVDTGQIAEIRIMQTLLNEKP